MAEEIKTASKDIKIKITERTGWIFDGKNYMQGEVVSVAPDIYESIKNVIQHEVK